MKRPVILYYLIICFSFLGSSLVIGQEKPIIKFGIIADIQYCDNDTRGSRFYRNSLDKLEASVNDLNSENIEFSVVLGDLVDRDTPRNLDSVLIRLQKLDSTTYITTGNHDYDGISDNKALFEKLNMPSEYYAFTKDNWLFIMLNTNELSSYSKTDDPIKNAEYENLTEKLKSENRPNLASYNGGISKAQMKWLKQKLISAEEEGKEVFIFSHHPLSGIPGLTALNDIEILETLAKHSCVKCVISGHHHPGAFDTYRGIPLITTEGMIETENENAYSYVEIYQNRIELIGKGRTKSYSLMIE